MSCPQDDYAGRLPYGYWYSPAQDCEYLFDRGYNAIARRPLAEPWKVEVFPKRRFVDTGPGRVELTFYLDGSSPRHRAETTVMCERVLARFVMGRDVRPWLRCNKRSGGKQPGLEPRTGGNYLKGQIAKRNLEFLSVEDCVVGRSA